MLVLTRKPGESIFVDTPDGNRIEVIIIGSKKNSSGRAVRVGIKAPPEVVIARKELLARHAYSNGDASHKDRDGGCREVTGKTPEAAPGMAPHGRGTLTNYTEVEI